MQDGMDMDMEGADTNANMEGKGEDWSIYRDAFNPTALSLTHPKPKPKPWERAPVSAHAPRLAGQKIWKKANSVRSAGTKDQDKENAVQVEIELEKGGMGARKRRRGVGFGGKENIADARWLSVDSEGVERAVEEVVEGSPRKMGVLRDEDALVVPRKRTNTNHLITPRKPLRSIENSIVAAPVLQVEESSMLKSPMKGAMTPLNDEGAVQEEKPRRRKSMRKSRRLTKSDLVEESGEGRRDSFVFGEKTELVEEFSGLDSSILRAAEPVDTPAAAEELTLPEASCVVEETTVSEPVVEAAEQPETVSSEQDTPSAEISSAPRLEQEAAEQETATQIEDPAFVPQNVEAEPEPMTEEDPSNGVDETLEEQSVPEHASKLPILSDTVLETIEEQSVLESTGESSATATPDVVLETIEEQSVLESTVELSATQDVVLDTIEEQPNQAAAEPILKSPTSESVELESIANQPPQTPLRSLRSQAPTLESVEPNMALALSPAKSAATPRSKRKTPQRSATRRSTRTTRNSSVLREETPIQVVVEAEISVQITEAPAPVVEDEIHQTDSTAIADNIATSLDAKQAENHEKKSGITSPAPSIPQGEENTDTDNATEITRTTETTDNTSEPQPEQDTALEDKDETLVPTGFENFDEPEEGSSEQDSCDEQLRQDLEISTPKRKNVPAQEEPSSEDIADELAESFEVIEPSSITTPEALSPTDETTELQGSSTPDPSTTELTETISENAPSAVYDHDETDMLRNFMSKVQANKAAKAKTSLPKRKRSLPHSPLQIPLGTVDANSPSPPAEKDEFDVSLPTASPTKRRKRNDSSHVAIPQEEDLTEPRSIRRSGRTRLPVKAAPAAPSFIPVRRIGQDGDSTVTLRRNEEKELAALTKVNTRKNKSNASHPAIFLAKKADEKDDPAVRQRALKDAFEEKNYKQKLNRKGMTVVWAEELAQFQTEEGRKVVVATASSVPVPEKEGKKEKSKKEGKKVAVVENDKEPEREKEKAILPGDDKKPAASSASASAATSTPNVKVGMRSKMTLGMAANGTPAPKRRVRGRS